MTNHEHFHASRPSPPDNTSSEAALTIVSHRDMTYEVPTT